jgi:hypothetical protein
VNLNTTVTDNSDGTYTVTGACYFLKTPYSVVVPADGYDRWLRGELAQVALAALPKEQREFLISGYSPDGWNALFGGLGEEDEGEERTSDPSAEELREATDDGPEYSDEPEDDDWFNQPDRNARHDDPFGL